MDANADNVAASTSGVQACDDTTEKPSKTAEGGERDMAHIGHTVSLSKTTASSILDLMSSGSVQTFQTMHKIIDTLEAEQVEARLAEEEKILKDMEKEMEHLQPNWASLKKPAYKSSKDISTEPELAHISRRSIECDTSVVDDSLSELKQKHKQQAHIVHELRDKVSLLEYARTQDERLLRRKLGESIKFEGPAFHDENQTCLLTQELEAKKEEQAQLVRCCQNLKLALLELKDAHQQLVSSSPSVLKTLLHSPSFLRRKHDVHLSSSREYHGEESVGKSAAKHLERVQETLPNLLQRVEVEPLLSALNKYDDALNNAFEAKKVVDKIKENSIPLSTALEEATKRLEEVNAAVKDLETKKESEEHRLHDYRDLVVLQLLQDKATITDHEPGDEDSEQGIVVKLNKPTEASQST